MNREPFTMSRTIMEAYMTGNTMAEKLSEKISENKYRRSNRSMRTVVDLSVAHTDEELGLEMQGITYLWLTVEKADSEFTYKIKQTNQQKSGVFIGRTGSNLEQHEFTEVLITNEASSGEAVIQVGWRE